jgi:hypothetical protein
VYHPVVRRAITLALLGVFGFPLIPQSAFASDAERGLPSCCRRKGAHHCSTMKADSSGPALQSPTCRFFPTANLVSAPPNAGVLVIVPVAGVSLSSSPVSQRATETPYPLRFLSPRQQRGPPTLFLS